jgi:hypothetical protein
MRGRSTGLAADEAGPTRLIPVSRLIVMKLSSAAPGRIDVATGNAEVGFGAAAAIAPREKPSASNRSRGKKIPKS